MSAKLKRDSISGEDRSDNSNIASTRASLNTDMETDPDPSELEAFYECDQLLDITKCFVNLHSAIARDVTSIKGEFKGFKATVSDIEESLSYSHQDILDLQENEIPQIRNSISAETNERLKLEIWRRNWNVIITGIPGSGSEISFESEYIVRAYGIT